MKRKFVVLLALVIVINLNLPAFALSGYTFSRITPSAPFSFNQSDPAVKKAYGKAIDLAN